MTRPSLPPWLWFVGGLLLLSILSDNDFPVVPALFVGFIVLRVLGQRNRSRGSGTGPARVDAPVHDEGGPMPTIDIPRYPGAGGPVSSTPPPPPTPYPSMAAPVSTPFGGAPEDPAVSMARLQLASCARDLDLAARHGHDAEVQRVVADIRGEVARLKGMRESGLGTPGTGGATFAAGLGTVGRLADEAAGERPPGPAVARLVQACRAMGETGRHE
ncbi:MULTISPECIES: hypothetical protein [unclassified Ornithinimicrobium]|uniref:hypothetical protein n=1 Tax=unclassified Ornithinimicrobium TaxID=2615080 RepID=UPI003854A2B9